MAWLETCRNDACNQIDHKKKEKGLSLNKACEELSAESGIGKSTLKKWYIYPDGEPVRKRTTKQKTGEANQQAVWEKVAQKIDGLNKFISKNCDFPPELTESIETKLIDGLSRLNDLLKEFRERYISTSIRKT